MTFNYGQPISEKLAEIIKTYTVAADYKRYADENKTISRWTIERVSRGRSPITEDNEPAVIEMFRIALIRSNHAKDFAIQSENIIKNELKIK